MRTLGGLLALALALAPLRADAREPRDLAKVEQLYDAGRDLYETADYDGAIARWTEAYSMLGDSAEHSDIRTTLLYNLASAHEEAFRIDGDTTHLTKAKVLLERFEQKIDELYEGEAVETERERVAGRMATIDAKLSEARGTADDEPEPEPEPEPEQVPTSVPEPEPDPAADERSEVPVDAPRGKGRPLMIAGSVLTVLGAGGLGLGIAAVVEANGANDFSEAALGMTPEALDLRRDQITRGQTMNTLTYVGLIAGGALVVTGATLLGLSARKKKAGEVALVPVLDPRHAGVLLRGSF